MKRVEALISILLGIIAVSGAVTWMYGPWGTVGGGIALIVVPFIMDIEEDSNG